MQRKQDKLTLKFNPETYVVVKRARTNVVAKNDQRVLTRSVSRFKKVRPAKDLEYMSMSKDENKDQSKKKEQ